MPPRGLLDAFVSNASTQHIDTQRLGLVGYQLSGKISASLAANDNRIGALFLVDPVDVATASGPIDGISEIARVTLAGNATVALLGAQITTTGSPPCVQSPPTKSFQDFYDSARMPAVAIKFGGANLGDFIDNFYDTYCTKDSTAPRTRTQDLEQEVHDRVLPVVAHMARARSREYLLGTDFATDQQNSMVTRRSSSPRDGGDKGDRASGDFVLFPDKSARRQATRAPCAAHRARDSESIPLKQKSAGRRAGQTAYRRRKDRRQERPDVVFSVGARWLRRGVPDRLRVTASAPAKSAMRASGKRVRRSRQHSSGPQQRRAFCTGRPCPGRCTPSAPTASATSRRSLISSGAA